MRSGRQPAANLVTAKSNPTLRGLRRPLPRAIEGYPLDAKTRLFHAIGPSGFQVVEGSHHVGHAVRPGTFDAPRPLCPLRGG